MKPLTTAATRPPIHRNTKRTGELSEAAFLLKAETLGFHIANPWGDSERYDSVIGRGPTLLRVQVKSASRYADARYRVRTTGASYTIYNAAEIDFLVAHILPVDVCYILPIAAIEQCTSLRFYPDFPCKCARWEQYREAWHLFL